MNKLVILSAAKDHLAEIERRKMILRCAQDDRFGKFLWLAGESREGQSSKTMENSELIEEATAARIKAIAKFSRFKVGAALLSEDGAVFHGCNVENCTLGLTMCAERVALLSALAAGERKFTTLAVVTQTEVPSTPCGACRQLLWEFCGDIEIILASTGGSSRTVKLSALFPEPFELNPENQ